MKKFIAVILLVTMCLFSGCDAINKALNISKAPTIEDVSDTEKTIYFYRGNLRIFSKLYLPEGEGPFPLVVIAAGKDGRYVTNESLAINLTKNGIAGLIFDYTCLGSTLSDGDPLDASIKTYIADVDAIVDGLKTIDYIDKENVFLWGHSMGGLAATSVAAKRPGEIKGLIGLEPSYQLPSEVSEMVKDVDLKSAPDVIYEPEYTTKKFIVDMISINIYDEIPNYKGNVLIICGDNKNSIGGEYTEYMTRADDLFESSELVFISGASHVLNGNDYSKMTDMTIEFVKNNLG